MTTPSVMPTIEDADRLPALLEQVLTATVDVFENAGVQLPDRRYICVGLPVADCPQLVVELVQVYLGNPGNEINTPRRCDAPRTAVLAVNLIRSIPVMSARGTPPTPDAISESAAELSRDMWLLFEGASFTDEFGLGVLADATPLEPSGGLGGSRLSLVLAVP